MDDEQIIALYQSRNEAATKETRAKYGGYCFKVAHNILGNEQDAEECVADTMLHAWQAIPPARPVRLRLFLAKIARNLAFDHCRRMAADKRGGGNMTAVLDELAECVADTVDVEDSVLEKTMQECIHRFLSGLDSRERQVFLRRYFMAEPVAQIAEEFHMKPNTVSVMLGRTRKKLQAHLQKEGYAL